MKKVLHYVAVMNRGGEETFLINVFNAIDRKNISFDFLCSLPGKGDYDNAIKGLGGDILHVELSSRESKLKQIDNFFILYKYLKTVKEKYAAFHIHTQHAMDGFRDALAAKLAGIPIVIVHSHSTSTLYHVRAHKLFQKPLDLLPIKKIACSELAGKWLFGEKGRFEVIPNGVDTKQYRFSEEVRESVRRTQGWEGKLIVGHVGSFTYPKNHEFLIDVFQEIHKIHRDSRLVMAGKGELQDNVREKVKRLGLEDSVEFLGLREDIKELDQAFDVMAFPSRYEGLPVVLVEAQCTGLPCVASDSITREVEMGERITWMSLQATPKQWAGKIIESAENRAGKREEAYCDVELHGYSIEKTAQRLTRIYCEG